MNSAPPGSIAMTWLPYVPSRTTTPGSAPAGISRVAIAVLPVLIC
jgi:hypothetical protein